MCSAHFHVFKAERAQRKPAQRKPACAKAWYSSKSGKHPAQKREESKAEADSTHKESKAEADSKHKESKADKESKAHEDSKRKAQERGNHESQRVKCARALCR